jgi:hypothetical protein
MGVGQDGARCRLGPTPGIVAGRPNTESAENLDGIVKIDAAIYPGADAHFVEEALIFSKDCPVTSAK